MDEQKVNLDALLKKTVQPRVNPVVPIAEGSKESTQGAEPLPVTKNPVTGETTPSIPAPVKIAVVEQTMNMVFEEEQDVTAFVHDNFEQFRPKYEDGYIVRPTKKEQEGMPSVWIIEWMKAPTYAEATLMEFHLKSQTLDTGSYRDKVNAMIEEQVEDEDKQLVYRFVELVDYDAEACKPIMEGNAYFLSHIAEIDKVTFHMQYATVKVLQEIRELLRKLNGSR